MSDSGILTLKQLPETLEFLSDWSDKENDSRIRFDFIIQFEHLMTFEGKVACHHAVQGHAFHVVLSAEVSGWPRLLQLTECPDISRFPRDLGMSRHAQLRCHESGTSTCPQLALLVFTGEHLRHAEIDKLDGLTI